ncbi:NADH-quinone oxidoreductase subunit C [Caloramator sp. mosi_1]|uniref:NADH-quinone oxidoreductase subunit C n=1 Tax=Caloramator sp. mosi_1 TaxID=3023090 RepID=UPI00235F71F6|nr:NADH-quinone oxidoreductase subunit C [Caloramator sp. mosi_1]WDC85173.1 NADH-quinone oxidoreductase subunit C [Caloramator sp. mosi_1]
MRFKDLIKELQNEYKLQVKNKNEIYIDVEKENIRDVVNSMFLKFKLYFVAEFCVDNVENFIINVVLNNRKNGYYVILRYKTDEDIVSLQGLAYQSELFEREISDLFGLKINGGKDTRNIVKHEIWQDNVYPLRKDFKFKDKVKDSYEIQEYRFKEISGDGAYQIPVGPVHAGIIEPGHFRFSVIGEDIENLEIRLMYKHRGIEKLCENVSADKLNLVFERVAGESSVAYSEAYALLIEKLLEFGVADDIKVVRTILLELERIYNFLDDIAGICVDVGYSYPAKKFSYLSELIHQLNEKISGSRFLRNTIIPGGINIDLTKEKISTILETIENVEERFEAIVDMTLNSVSFLDRVEITGIVENEVAKTSFDRSSWKGLRNKV